MQLLSKGTFSQGSCLFVLVSSGLLKRKLGLANSKQISANLVFSNAHVVDEGCDSLVFERDGYKAKASVSILVHDPVHDLAALVAPLPIATTLSIEPVKLGTRITSKTQACAIGYGDGLCMRTNVFDIDPPRRDGAVADFSGLVIRGMSGGSIVVVEGSTDNPVITDQVVGLTFARTDGNTGWAMLLDASHVEAALDRLLEPLLPGHLNTFVSWPQGPCSRHSTPPPAQEPSSVLCSPNVSIALSLCFLGDLRCNRAP